MNNKFQQTLIDARLYQQARSALMAKERELARSKREIQKLAKQVQGSLLPTRQLERARDDAHVIIAFAIAHEPTSRRACEEWGISRRRWNRATRLLLASMSSYPQLYVSEAVDQLSADLTSNPKALHRLGLRYSRNDVEQLANKIRAATHVADFEQQVRGGRLPIFSD